MPRRRYDSASVLVTSCAKAGRIVAKLKHYRIILLTNPPRPQYTASHLVKDGLCLEPVNIRSSRRSRFRRKPNLRSLLGALMLLALAVVTPAFAADLATALAALERSDYRTAVAQLDELSGQGDPRATTKLATLYQEGRGVPRDATRAAMLYEQAAARGDADAQYNLGNMYLLGEGVPQDDDWAFTYYREAAKQGHAMAQKNVAEFYRAAGLAPPPEEVNSKPREVVSPPPRVASETPPPPVAASADPVYAVGSAPAEYSQDELNAMQLARKHGIRIADAGSLPPPPRGTAGTVSPPPGRPDAAPSPSGGLDTAKELLAAGKLSDARTLLEAEANEGNAEAQYLLAQLLVTLSNGAADNASALAWLQRAAAGGYADAQYLLGVRYERGEGVLPDDAEAVTWYRAAARQGHPEAAARLRAIYRDAGVPLPEDAAPPRERQGAASPASRHRLRAQRTLHDSASRCTLHACSQQVG